MWKIFGVGTWRRQLVQLPPCKNLKASISVAMSLFRANRNDVTYTFSTASADGNIVETVCGKILSETTRPERFMRVGPCRTISCGNHGPPSGVLIKSIEKPLHNQWAERCDLGSFWIGRYQCSSSTIAATTSSRTCFRCVWASVNISPNLTKPPPALKVIMRTPRGLSYP